MTIKCLNLKALLPFLMIVALYSCNTESEYEKQVKEEDLKIQTFLDENGISAERHATGIYYEALETNSGGEQIEAGDVVSFYYKLSTLDSAYEEEMEDSVNAVLTEHAHDRVVPSGLYSGFNLMKEGEKYRFFIPSYLAYDSYGSTDTFNPYSIFIIDVEVTDISSKDDLNELEMDSLSNYIENNNIEDLESFSSGLFYKTIQAGDGDQAAVNKTVKFNYERKYLDGTGLVKSETDKPVVVNLNESNMIKGLVEGISKMKEGETAMFIVPSKLAYGSSFLVLPRDARDELIEDNMINSSPLPFSPVIYEVELLEVN